MHICQIYIDATTEEGIKCPGNHVKADQASVG